jgi:hypothetical protein
MEKQVKHYILLIYCRVLLFSLLGYMGAYYLVLVIVNSFKIPAHIYLPLSGALNYAGAFSGIAIATGLSIEGFKKAAYKLKVCILQHLISKVYEISCSC